MNSRDMTTRSLAMAEKLTSEEEVEKIFLSAVQIVDEVAGNWDRDSIRTEPVTKAITEKFGHVVRRIGREG